MKGKSTLLKFIVIVVVLFVFVRWQSNIRVEGFRDGFDCSLHGTDYFDGGDSDSDSSKLCRNYYADAINEITEAIEKLPNTEEGEVTKIALKERRNFYSEMRELGTSGIMGLK